MRILFVFVFSLLLTTSELMSSVPNATKELDIFKDKMTLQNAKNMFSKALNLYYENKTDEMIKSYHELIDKFESSTNKDIKAIIAQSMFNLALGYNNKNNTKAEEELYEQISSKFIDTDDADIEFIVANSLFNQSTIAYTANDRKREEQIYQKFIDRFKYTNNEGIHILMANVMTSLGYVYRKTNRMDESVNIYNETIDKFKNFENEYVQNLVAGTLLDLGINYITLNKIKDGLGSYEELIEQFKNSTNPYIVRTVGAAVTNKIEIEICNDIKPSFNDENQKLANRSEYSAFMYEFLQIIYASVKQQQTEKLALWREKYLDFGFEKLNVEFDFSDLDGWIKKLKNPQKTWAKECLDALKAIKFSW